MRCWPSSAPTFPDHFPDRSIRPGRHRPIVASRLRSRSGGTVAMRLGTTVGRCPQEDPMTTTSKLRVSVADQADALEILRSEVEGATGLSVEPELQEAEHDELVVEMRFTGLVTPEPQLVARAVQRSSSGIDVLSSWNEQLPART